MNSVRARTMLAAYSLFGSFAYPVIGPYVSYRVTKGKEDAARRRERYGYAGLPRPDGPLVWLHAASVGEAAAAEPLARSIASDGINVLMTTGTTTSAKMVGERLAGDVIHQFVPLDLKPAVSRFLDYWHPELAIVAESEIWPLTSSQLARRRIPQVLVNARLSDSSFKRWKSAPWLAETLMERFAHVVAQSEVDGERFHLLGARTVTVAGNLKADVDPPKAKRDITAAYAQAIGRRPRWAALSTHPGEEEVAARAHEKLRQRYPGLLTIIVPRHVDRSDEIEASLTKAGLKVVRRSRNEVPDALTDILLGDTMGEMGLFLRLTEIAFIGKSLTGQGGQNPLEAAMLDTAVLSGRFVQNFRDAYQRLLKNGGARLVRDLDGLVEHLDLMLGERAITQEMARAGASTVEEMRGGLLRTSQALQPFLHPLKLSIGLKARGQDSSPT